MSAVAQIDMSKLRMAGAGVAIVGSAVSAELAWLHAKTLSAFGVICGGLAPHCGWCVATVGFAAVAVAALTVEWRERRQAAVPVKVKAERAPER
ncbi:hypothetical protein [Phenylobacterium sp.]|uniref:hypothetical protein n=1 Tax=Phenylobacterium sp. TaxID=1871053 RepID=UPI0035AF15F1